MLAGMAMAAFMCILIGVYPKFLYDMLPYPIHYVPYTAEHLVWTSRYCSLRGSVIICI